MRNALPVKKTVTVNGVTTEYSLSGEGGPVIVLLNGFRMPMFSWDKFYPAIQQHGRIFAYNRHGIGKTSKATGPQTGAAVIQALESVLNALHLAPPYILVAHSLGGLFANLYARSKPADIAAVVFIEASHPHEKSRQENFQPPAFIRFVTGILKAIDTRFDKYQHSEDDCVAETVRQIEAAGNFPAIPVAVVTGGKKMPLVPEACFAVHRQCQNELTAFSPHSIQIIANNSGHFPQLTEPELVIRAIKEIMDKVELGAKRGI